MRRGKQMTCLDISGSTTLLPGDASSRSMCCCPPYRLRPTVNAENHRLPGVQYRVTSALTDVSLLMQKHEIFVKATTWKAIFEKVAGQSEVRKAHMSNNRDCSKPGEERSHICTTSHSESALGESWVLHLTSNASHHGGV